MMYSNIESDLYLLNRDLEDYSYSYETAINIQKRTNSSTTMEEFAKDQVERLPALIEITKQQLSTLGRIKAHQSVTKEQLDLLTEAPPAGKNYSTFPEYKNYLDPTPSMLPASSSELAEAGPSVPTSSSSTAPAHHHRFFRIPSVRNLKSKVFRTR